MARLPSDPVDPVDPFDPFDPFRSAPAPAWPPSPVPGRAVLDNVLAASAMTVTIGAWIVSSPLAAIGAFLGMAGLIGTISHVREARALHRLPTLPFPVRHAAVSGLVGLANPHAIRTVTVHLIDELDRAVFDRAAADLAACAPELAIERRPRMLVITGWRSFRDDRAVLMGLLETWGCTLHAAQPIEDVVVTWLQLPPR